MNTVSMSTLHTLFAIHEQSLSSRLDMNRLSDGGYSAYLTIMAFHNFCAGFNACYNMHKGDNK